MILDNPFHLLGLLADSGAREKVRRESRIKAYLGVGKPLVFPDDLYFQGCRRNQATMERALSQLPDARDRIGYGLFWFTQGCTLDSHALPKLRQGDLQGALATWQRIEDRIPTRNYASCLNNLGTLYLLMALSGPAFGERWPRASKERVAYLERGLRAKARLVGMLGEPELADFCRTFSDALAVHDSKVIVTAFGWSFFETIAEAEKYGIDVPAAAIVRILESGGPRTAELTEKLVLEGREAVQRAINTCAAAYEHDPSQAAAAGKQLMVVTRETLSEFAALVSRTDIRYTSIADQTAEAVLDSDVTYFNWRSKTGGMSREALKTSLQLAEYAAEIACGAAIRQRARENVETTMRFVTEREQVEAMAGVRERMMGWLDRANDMARKKPIPRQRLAFVGLSLKRSAGTPTSALDLMEAVRLQGIKVFGPDFPRSGEMIDLGTLVCQILMGCVISAHNDSSVQSEVIRAAQILQGLPTHFRSVSDASNRSAHARVRHYVADSHGAVHPSQFLVSDECFQRLMQNVRLSIPTTIATTSSTRGQSGRGCALAALGGIATVIVLALVTDTGAGPSATPSPADRTRPLEFQMPPVGEGRVLSMPELRWCVREDGRIERERRVRRTSLAEVDRFNRRVDNYNSRCGSFQYRRGELEQARREVGAGGR